MFVQMEVLCVAMFSFCFVDFLTYMYLLIVVYHAGEKSISVSVI